MLASLIISAVRLYPLSTILLLIHVGMSAIFDTHICDVALLQQLVERSSDCGVFGGGT